MLHSYIMTLDTVSKYPAFAILETIVIASMFVIFLFKWMQYCKLNHVSQHDQTTKQQRFRLEISEVSDNYVQTGLDVPSDLDGASMGATLLTGLTIIGKKDPLVLRMILLHTLDILSKEPDIKEALESFDKKH